MNQGSIKSLAILQLVVLLISIVSEQIGIIKQPLGPGTIVLLPLLYAFIFGLLFNPNVIKAAKLIVDHEATKTASTFLLIGILPFIAKFGSLIGPSMDQIVAAGPAMALQELGNVATIFIAMPVAVLLFGMGREAIGATHSIAREPNIALISDRYGLKTPEGVGVMGVYVMGTVFGSIFFAMLASFLASTNLFDVRALAMACGVGSGSMMAACSGALATVLPERETELLAFAGASNLMTYATGLYVSLFVAIPCAEFIYQKLDRLRNKRA
ncbi:DUF3100 family protein [Sinobacterium caligoides]|uniref:DUF3100 family protein n=1 Tax=Sinobacterium caligoides TaxID=933926 RepID=A0A3N2DE63_9GAMM|nr:DUF3100 domain-containing protein [Sinobacterium caligoides]ROR98017.1 DUF3100 family protein [Sinobacterium caligoides]